MEHLESLSIWNELTQHSKDINNIRIKELFSNDLGRFNNFSLRAAGIFLDYSKNRVKAKTMSLLGLLAKQAGVLERRTQMVNGDKINVTQQRAVLHTLLRNTDNQSLREAKVVKEVLSRMEGFVNSVRSGAWLGYSGKHITDIVNIGIGGSDLGPAMIVRALHPYCSKVKLHFVSNLDPTHIAETLKLLNHETTLFIVASKSFTTQETLINALTAREWLLNNSSQKDQDVVSRHFITVTSRPEKAVDFGILPANILPFWDWVGGRFSLWSAIGVSIALAIGMDKFYELLSGAREMDDHFLNADIESNMPIILALIGIWNINFLGAHAQAVIPYDQSLSLFPTYLQQLEMESNGKRVNIEGKPLQHKTAPVIFGGIGTNSQHSFHQLLMQGTEMVPVDFVISLSSHNQIGNHHLLLYANCLAQSQALMLGHNEDEVASANVKEGSEEIDLTSHKMILGNIPSNTIVLDKLTPKSLGALIALYEHKVFVQGIIWQINSFDQWGVELGKKLAKDLVPILQGEKNVDGLDGSTVGLVDLYHNSR